MRHAVVLQASNALMRLVNQEPVVRAGRFFVILCKVVANLQEFVTENNVLTSPWCGGGLIKT